MAILNPMHDRLNLQFVHRNDRSSSFPCQIVNQPLALHGCSLYISALRQTRQTVQGVFDPERWILSTDHLTVQLSVDGGSRMQYLEYSADDRLTVGYWGAARAILREIWTFRSHVRTIFSQQFRDSYRGTALGVLWNFVLPLLPISVYVLLATFRVFPSFAGTPAALAIAFNATLWFLFASSLQGPMSIVKSRNAEAMKTSLPLSTSVVAGFAQTAFELLVRVVAVIVIALALGIMPSTMALAGLAIAGAGVMLALGFGLILAIANIVYPDVQRLVSIGLTYGIFVSGVIFPLSEIPQLSFLEWANPFAALIKAARDLTFSGVLTDPMSVGTWAMVGLVIFIVGVRVFFVMEKRIRSVV